VLSPTFGDTDTDERIDLLNAGNQALLIYGIVHVVTIVCRVMSLDADSTVIDESLTGAHAVACGPKDLKSNAPNFSR